MITVKTVILVIIFVYTMRKYYLHYKYKGSKLSNRFYISKYIWLKQTNEWKMA